MSIVLPVYNECGHLAAEIERIREAMQASGYSYEIIVIDDGSDDGSADELANIADAGADVRLLSFARNRGSGTARRIGSQQAAGRVIAWTDADMSYPNERIPELVGLLDAGWDQVVGARTTEAGTSKALRVPAKWFIRRLAAFLADTDIPDLNSGLRVFRTDVGRQFLHLLPTGFSCVTTLTMTFLANGYSVGYTPVGYAERSGRSKFHWWRDTKRYLIQVVRMILSYDPLRVFIPLGVALSLIGTVKLVVDFVRFDFHVATTTVVLLVAAFQVFAIGLLADLVVRVTKRADLVAPAQH